MVGTGQDPNYVTAPSNGYWGIRILATGRTGTQANCGSMGDATNNLVVGNSMTLISGTAYDGVVRWGGSVAGNSFAANVDHVPSGDCSSLRWRWWSGSAVISISFSGNGTTWRTLGEDPSPDGTCGS